MISNSSLQNIRHLLWIYFLLLIFEGALRKWVVPGLSSPLLLVREPIALLALWLGWPLLKRPTWNNWTLPILLIGFVGFLFTLSFGHADIYVAIYGLRTFLIQLPLIFLFPAVFDRNDVIKFCWVLVVLCIPMTLLIVAQSNSPTTHILNIAPGGEGSAAFDGALGRNRPPGTFSFITGVVSFYSLAAASFFSLLYDKKSTFLNLIVLSVAGIALIVALPVSISRSLLAGYLQVILAVIVALVLSRTKLTPLLYGLFGIVISVLVASNVPAFQDTSEAFVARWENAGAASGSVRSNVGDVGVAADQLSDRVLPSLTRPFANLDHTPLFGYGIGMGTNVAAQRLTGNVGFLTGETAWESSILELGYFLGPLFVLWRVSFSVWIVRLGLKASRSGSILSLTLSGASAFNLMQGQIAQPTALGFLVFSVGLTLASLNYPHVKL